MKKLLIPILLLAACNTKTSVNEPRYKLLIFNGEGLDQSVTAIKCDSFRMVSDKEAEFWRYGTKNTIKAGQCITPYSNL